MPVITCPNCGTQLNAPESLLGQQVTCGKCRCLFVAQSQTPPSARSGASQAQDLPGTPPPAGAGSASPPPPPPPPAMPPGQVGPAGYQQVTGGYYQPAPLASSGYAVASLVLGITSLVTCTCYALPPLICGPLAMVFSSRARNDIRSGVVSQSSSGMATAGKICGLIGLLLGIGYLVFIGVIIAVAAMQH